MQPAIGQVQLRACSYLVVDVLDPPLRDQVIFDFPTNGQQGTRVAGKEVLTWRTSFWAEVAFTSFITLHRALALQAKAFLWLGVVCSSKHYLRTWREKVPVMLTHPRQLRTWCYSHMPFVLLLQFLAQMAEPRNILLSLIARSRALASILVWTRLVSSEDL